MAEEQIPQAWIGQRVTLRRNASPGDQAIGRSEPRDFTLSGPLHGVNELGISFIREFGIHDGTVVYSGPDFYPWASIWSISPEVEMTPEEFQRIRETGIP
jgi:hypothetical protein